MKRKNVWKKRDSMRNIGNIEMIPTMIPVKKSKNN